MTFNYIMFISELIKYFFFLSQAYFSKKAVQNGIWTCLKGSYLNFSCYNHIIICNTSVWGNHSRPSLYNSQAIWSDRLVKKVTTFTTRWQNTLNIWPITTRKHTIKKWYFCDYILSNPGKRSVPAVIFVMFFTQL